LSFGLFNPGDPRLMFWIALGILASIPEVLQWIGRWRRKRKK
jgi:hypothetical protein